MRITLYGAAGGIVTGSAYLLEAGPARILIDCGMFSGGRKLESANRVPKSGPLRKADAILLTHAHIDHTGRLPLLGRLGYDGPVFATAATLQLTAEILRDAARSQVEDARRENRRRRGTRKPEVEPLYAPRDVEKILRGFRDMPYDQPVPVAPGIRVRAVEAGHLLGSASFEITVEEDGRRKVVVFSGDLGPRGAPLYRDPVPFKDGADLVFVESTYGDREHPTLAENAAAAREAIAAAVERGGRILIPVSAVGRAQILLYLIAGAFKRRTLKPFPIFLDSPMAIRIAETYRAHPELFDEEAIAMHRSGELAANLRTLQACRTASESAALATRKGPFAVLAGSAMCTGGRIMQHLQNRLPDPTTLVMMVGYQSRGSVGRAIADGAPSVRVSGRTVTNGAKAHVLGGMSGHAGQAELLDWIGSLAPARPSVVITHGEDDARTALAGKIAERFGLSSRMPAQGETIEA